MTGAPGPVPGLSVVIPWKDRPEIGTTLGHNRALLAGAGGEGGVEVVVVNCGGDSSGLRAALAPLAAQPGPAVRVLHLPGVAFNKPLALNLGAHVALAGRLFFLDADVLLDAGLVPAALALLRTPCAVTVARVTESQPTPSAAGPDLREIAHLVELVGRRNRRVRLETSRVRFADGSRSGPGLALLRREDFVAVEGMNAELAGWAWNDLDLLARLQLDLRLPRRQVGRVVHLSHGDDARDLAGTTRAANEAANFAAALANYSLGHYLGTLEEDTARFAGALATELALPASPPPGRPAQPANGGAGAGTSGGGT